MRVIDHSERESSLCLGYSCSGIGRPSIGWSGASRVGLVLAGPVKGMHCIYLLHLCCSMPTKSRTSGSNMSYGWLFWRFQWLSTRAVQSRNYLNSCNKHISKNRGNRNLNALSIAQPIISFI